MISPTRLPTIDIIRGYCIASMVAGHIASGSVLSRALHPFPQFDGASGFVLLSGLVLGMVQRRRIDRDGLAAVEIKTARRIGLIYVAQLAITLIGIVAFFAATRDHENLPPLAGASPLDVAGRSLAMMFAPPVGSVLRLYVLLLAFAGIAYLLLDRGRWATVLAGSAVLYVIGNVWPQHTSFVALDGRTPGASWAGWQFLFITALLLGWGWTALDVPGRLRRHPWLFGVPAVAVIVAGRFLGDVFPTFFDKLTFAPGRILVAYSVVVLLYVALDVALRVVPRTVFRPIEVIGTRSLDSYIIQAAFVIVVASFTAFAPRGFVAQMLVLVVLALCWGWAEARRLRSRRRTTVLQPLAVHGVAEPNRA